MQTTIAPNPTRVSSTLRSSWLLDFGLLFLLALALVFPLLRINQLDNWGSIESTFIADGRALQENWPHHLWQPLWYCGTRADYVYPPGLRTGVAVLTSLLHATPAHSYHIFIAIFYAFGLAAIYLWVRAGSGWRSMGWLAAIGVALLSPSFLVMPDVQRDSPFSVPWRLHVLMTYGEGPHISSLSVIPMVWLGAWRRFRGGGMQWLALSAAAAALAVSINFYGATTIAITFPLLVWACYLERLDWRILRDGAVIGTLAYGLTAWWLVPSFLSVTSRNLHLVAPEGNSWSVPVTAAIVAAYALLSLCLRRWQNFSPFVFFVASGFWFLSVYVLGYRWFGLQISGSSLRLIPELDFFAILLGCALIGTLWKWRPQLLPSLPRFASALLLVLCISPSLSYFQHLYFEFPRDLNWRDRVEYKTAKWLNENAPGKRVFVAGSIRFWYNVWHNGQQADGGSAQGILNPLLSLAQWRIVHTNSPDDTLHWLQALAVDVLVVSGPGSKEVYKDFQEPKSYDALFPLWHDDGAGNRYYRVPRTSPGIVRAVDRALVLSAPPVPSSTETAILAQYVKAIESPPSGGASSGRVQGQWKGSDAFDVAVDLKSGEALLFQESYDPAWRAYADGQPMAIRKDSVGFMLLDAPIGRHAIHIVFEAPPEKVFGRALTLTALALTTLLIVKGRKYPLDLHSHRNAVEGST